MRPSRRMAISSGSMPRRRERLAMASRRTASLPVASSGSVPTALHTAAGGSLVPRATACTCSPPTTTSTRNRRSPMLTVSPGSASRRTSKRDGANTVRAAHPPELRRRPERREPHVEALAPRREVAGSVLVLTAEIHAEDPTFREVADHPSHTVGGVLDIHPAAPAAAALGKDEHGLSPA